MDPAPSHVGGHRDQSRAPGLGDDRILSGLVPSDGLSVQKLNRSTRNSLLQQFGVNIFVGFHRQGAHHHRDALFVSLDRLGDHRFKLFLLCRQDDIGVIDAIVTPGLRRVFRFELELQVGGDLHDIEVVQFHELVL